MYSSVLLFLYQIVLPSPKNLDYWHFLCKHSKRKTIFQNEVSTAKASSMMNATLTSSGYVYDEMITDQSFIR